jgi:hypothetical protein
MNLEIKPVLLRERASVPVPQRESSMAKGKDKMKPKKVVVKTNAAAASSKGGPPIMPTLGAKKK